MFKEMHIQVFIMQHNRMQRTDTTEKKMTSQCGSKTKRHRKKGQNVI
jgi:hypothetical protein